MNPNSSHDDRIRRALHTDTARIFEIRAAVRENRLSDPSLVTSADVAWFIDHGPIWVWDEAGRIAGFSAGDPRDSSIWALFVDPGDEHRGIGRALLCRVCETLRAAGHRVASLSTEPGTRAERFYHRSGWVVTGRNAKGELMFEKEI